jgi:hypothetical protein
VILFLERAKTFLSRRWKLIAVVSAVFLALFYLISDALFQKSSDLTGLGPQEIVSTYYRAIDRLDLQLIDELFYRGAGKSLRRDLASLYVLQKVGTAYGRHSSSPEEDAEILQIENLTVIQQSDGDNPVFRATYRRVLHPDETTSIEQIEETIYLHKKDDRWYITDSVLRTVDSNKSR